MTAATKQCSEQNVAEVGWDPTAETWHKHGCVACRPRCVDGNLCTPKSVMSGHSCEGCSIYTVHNSIASILTTVATEVRALAYMERSVAHPMLHELRLDVVPHRRKLG